MIIQFSVTNHRSFQDEANLSFLATKDQSLSTSLISLSATKNVLPAVAIYGANAAGKSNLLHAIATMQSMIVGEKSRPIKGDTLPFEPFSFCDPNSLKPTKFEVIFVYQNIKYAYGYMFNEKQIIEEYLYHWPNGREALIFSRNKNDYEFRDNIAEQTTLAGRTPGNRLYLVSSNEWNCPQTENAFAWFRDCVITHLVPSAEPNETLEIMKESDTQRANVLRELLLANLGISDVQPTESFINGKRIVMTTHHTTDADGNECTYQLSLDKESTGTQRFFARIGAWMRILEKGTLFVIDEIEASMHPLLTRRLIEMIQDTQINTNGAQLLFTTHDTGLLDQSLLRRDQIWFVERNEKTAASTLFALTDFSPRKGENIQKGYLVGRFGAIPFIQGGDAPWAE